MTFEEVDTKLGTLQPFIQYLLDTDESEWRVDTVRNADNTENCLFGHLVNFIYGKDYKDSISRAWDFFEEAWSSTYEVYDINDGKDKRYQQPTPRQRCIAFMKDLSLGLQPPTWQQMENDHIKYKQAQGGAI
ncbi:hypothetical protein B5P43_18295 [Bacillus sp. SRB_336]|nr:hypothetical protein B5P43_18295 [Bacillus sp. SRB_336]